MKARAALTGALASLGILVVAWQFGSAAIGTHTTGSTRTGTSQGTPAPTGGASPTAAGITDGTYTGSSVNTRFGNVQVKVMVSSGKIDWPDRRAGRLEP